MKLRNISLFTLFLTGLSVASYAHCRFTTVYEGEVFKAHTTIQITWEIEIPHNQQNWDLYYSDDAGLNWYPIEEDIAVSFLEYYWLIPDLDTEEAQLKIVQDNDLTDYEDISGIFTVTSDVVTATSNTPDTRFKMISLPNPARDYLRISVELYKTGNITLDLFNPSGQEVQRLFHGRLNGDQTFTFQTAPLPQGMYTLRLASDGVIESRKVLIIH